MRLLKDFNRFAHDGVKQELVRLKKELAQLGGYEFGSSGDGELTARKNNVTTYVRKFRRKEGWRVVICIGSKKIQTTYPKSGGKVVASIINFTK